MISYITYFSHASSGPRTGRATVRITALAQRTRTTPCGTRRCRRSLPTEGVKPGEYRTEASPRLGGRGVGRGGYAGHGRVLGKRCLARHPGGGRGLAAGSRKAGNSVRCRSMPRPHGPRQRPLRPRIAASTQLRAARTTRHGVHRGVARPGEPGRHGDPKGYAAGRVSGRGRDRRLRSGHDRPCHDHDRFSAGRDVSADPYGGVRPARRNHPRLPAPGRSRGHGARTGGFRGTRRGAVLGRPRVRALNVSNFQTTESEIRYGRRLSELLGGARFVIDTSRNGNGSLRGGAVQPARPRAGAPADDAHGSRGRGHAPVDQAARGLRRHLPRRPAGGPVVAAVRARPGPCHRGQRPRGERRLTAAAAPGGPRRARRTPAAAPAGGSGGRSGRRSRGRGRAQGAL